MGELGGELEVGVRGQGLEGAGEELVGARGVVEGGEVEGCGVEPEGGGLGAVFGEGGGEEGVSFLDLTSGSA